jgi:hypothetical protein
VGHNDYQGSGGKERRVLQDLGVLAPSLIVCVAFLAGVYALLRREMAPRRRNSEGDGSAEDMPAGPGISAAEDDGPTGTSACQEVADPRAGRRSLD